MNMRDDWTINEEAYSDLFYTKDETVADVRENFDIHRYHSCEGYDILINGIPERCLVQTPNNPLRELNDYRKIHCPINSDVKRGYYVEFENSVWIIDTNVVNVDGAYLSTRMSRCQYSLRWQNKDDKIIERWGYSSDETKYSNGTTGNNAIMVPDNQYGLIIPIDSETKLLKRGMRFSFDFDDAEIPDIYELSNRKVCLKEGIIILSFSINSFNQKTDKLVTLEDGSQVWVCDYHSPTPSAVPSVPDEAKDLSIVISGGTILRYGRAKTWSVLFKDQNGNEITDCNFEWKVTSDFDVLQVIDGQKIRLKVEDEQLIDCSFFLSVITQTGTAKLEIAIVEGL